MNKIFSKVAVLVLALVASAGLASCGSSNDSAEKGTASNPVTIGVVGASEKQWIVFKQKAEAAGIHVEIKDFLEYSEPDPAESQYQLDLNEFQHILYLAKYNVDNNDNLVPIASTAVYPIGLYGSTENGITSLEDIAEGAKVAIPDDGTNQSRALFVLKTAGLIALKDDTKAYIDPSDIDKENSKVEVYPVVASQTAISITDPSISAAVINNDYVKNLSEEDKANEIYSEQGDTEGAKPYINIWVAREADQANPIYQKVIDLFKNDAEIQAALAEEAGGLDDIVYANQYSAAELQAIEKQQEEIYRASK